jgi:uncharacterized repeat protein (TIGR02543 family)
MSIRFGIILLLLVLGMTRPGHAALSKEKDRGKSQAVRLKADTAEGKEHGYKSGEILVKFREGVSPARQQNLHQRHGARLIKEFKGSRLHHLKFKDGTNFADTLERYRKDPDVVYAEPNYKLTIQTTPNDPSYSMLWGMNRINAPTAWDQTTGSNSVVVAVIDTGIDYTHPDLAANISATPGLDAVNNDNDPMDDNGHGSHVAGTIGAVGNNGTGVTGVNWNVKILACKAFDAYGNGYVDAAVACLNYVRSLKDSGVNIVATNNSWTVGNYFSQALYDAINAQRDILFVAAAANSGTNNDKLPAYPANFALPNIISVSATDSNDALAGFSNYGSRTVHVGAPGDGIYSTLPAVNAWGIDGGYGYLSGTSMAAPHVTGLAALLKAQTPGRDATTLKNLILASGDELLSLNGKTITGKQINVYGAMNCANKPVFAVQSTPSAITVGNAVTIAAMSINCAASIGPVTVKTGLGEIISLLDDGVAPDEVAGDGIFTGTWVPARQAELLTFSSPSGEIRVETPAVAIATQIVPEANITAHYSTFLTASGGMPGYTWEVVGSLPAGLTLNKLTGEVSGDTTAIGSYTTSFKVTDGFGISAEKSFPLIVSKDLLVEEWVRSLNSSGSDEYGSAVAVDSNGNVYAVGQTANSGRIVAKYDPAGNLLWNRVSPNTPWATGVAVDKSGNAYVTGGYTVTEKYDPAGNLLWTLSGNGHGLGVAIDENTNVYIAGNLGDDIVLMKYDAAGNPLWVRTYDNGKIEQASGVACDKNGNVYVTGIEFVSWPDSASLTLKFDTSGNLLWAQSYKTSSMDWGRAIAADRNGDVYVTGITSDATLLNEFLFLKYSSAGELLWSKPYPALASVGNGIAIDSTGDIYLSGYYNSGANPLVVKFTPAGDLIWAKDTDAQNGIAVGSDFKVSLVGSGYDPANYISFLVTSQFRQLDKRTLSYSKLGTGTGTVVFNPGSTCGDTCSDTYAAGSTITLTVIPDESSTFTGWGGACSGTGNCVVTLDADKSVSATFALKPQYPFMIKLFGKGYVFPDVGSYGCDAQYCSGNFYEGTAVTFTAFPYYGYKFSGWSGACTGTTPCSVIMTGAKSATAKFTELPTKKVNFTLSGSGNGYISPDQQNRFSCGAKSCSGGFAVGTSITYTAIPDDYSLFAGWSGACSGTDPSCTLKITKDLSIGAKFNLKVFNLALTIGGGKGSVSASPLPNGYSNAKCSSGTCNYPYNALTNVKLTAVPSPGYKFAGWSGACAGTSLSCTVSIDDAKAVTAIFGSK